ncbi:MAG: hypothetical protein A2Z20_06745 [Bdellovibrionales bacterium RBG_16_40_8]|nr:MAG: hypothetical protein A2Z20_06745 [Bdellovibrionales bacterium RBG_16_40_8]
MNRLEAQVYYDKMRRLFNDFHRVSLQTTEHETVFLRYQTLADIGTLPHCAEISNQYLHLQDGDIVLMNDPYSGGTLLSAPTLIMGIGTRTAKGSVPAEILITHRLTLKPQIGPAKTIDDEGLRIPPSPFYIKGSLNIPIIEALNSHPQATKKFTDIVNQEAQKLLAVREQIKSQIKSGYLDFSRATVKAYCKVTENEFIRRLDEIGEGFGISEISINKNENIKLSADYHEGHFTFDFSGTSAGETIFLTDSVTFGTVIGATISLLEEGVPINSGIFSRFDVKTPRGSMVNSSFPRPLFLGHTDGINLVANAVVRTLGTIYKKRAWATSGLSYCSYQLQFRSGVTFVDSLPVGSGAHEDQSGAEGVTPWLRFKRSPSIEFWEKKFPLQILNTGFRSNSGGDGRRTGGNGVVRSIKLLEDAKLSWVQLRMPHKPEGIEGGKSGLGPEMIIMRASGQKEELAASGVLELQKGDVLTILSSGGGGYGLK